MTKVIASVVSFLALTPVLATALDWASKAHETLLPTKWPNPEKADPWICPASNLTRFFDVPYPSPELYEAIVDYNREAFDSCTVTGHERKHECFPSKDYFCGITTAAPATALIDYSSYGSAASSWWHANSREAFDLVADCPSNWYSAMFDIPNGNVMLNLTIMFAACHAEARQTSGTADLSMSATVSQVSGTAKPGDSWSTETVAATPTPKPVNGLAGRDVDSGRAAWAASGAAAAAALAHSAL